MLCRLDQLPFRCGVKLLEAFLIDRLYDVLSNTGKFRDLFVRVGPASQEIADILVQFCRDPVSGGFKGNVLRPGVAASGTYILVPCK